MSVMTKVGVEMDNAVLGNYLYSLVDQFFKILPMKEEGEKSLPVYLQSLQLELLGCKSLVTALGYDKSYLTLLSILQYFIDHPDEKVVVVRREVFHAISICKKLKRKYAPPDKRVIA